MEKTISSNNSTFKELYGTNQAILDKQEKRYNSLIDKFSNVYGNKNFMLFSSPGRTEIGGNHTDHNYGRVLAGAVNMDNIAVAAGNNTNIVSVLSSGYEKFEVDLSNLAPVKSENYTSASIIRGISSRMKELGFTIGVRS